MIEIVGQIVNDDVAISMREEGLLVTAPVDIKQALADCKEETVDVNINSGGGDIIAGSEIYSLLRAFEKKVRINVMSLAGSAASVIAMAGDEVLMSPTGCIMIHNSFMSDGSDDPALLTINESMVNAYTLKSGVPRADVKKLMEEETWLTAGQAIKLGFADDLMFDEKDKAKMVAEAKEIVMENEETKSVESTDENMLKQILDAVNSIKKTVEKDDKKDTTTEEATEEPESVTTEASADAVVDAIITKMFG